VEILAEDLPFRPNTADVAGQVLRNVDEPSPVIAKVEDQIVDPFGAERGKRRIERFDGRLDEEVYAAVPAIDGFVQQVPIEGVLATEDTAVWIFFDEDVIYVSARNWESARERRVANEMRRDTAQLRQNDTFAVLFDTFHDRRNGYIFYANAIGGMSDSQVTDEGPPNTDWNTVWDVRTGEFDGGWVIEMAIPMALFFAVMFFGVLVVGWRLRFPYRDAVAVAFNATGRDFEIAIAIAITAFSPTVALATVVGPLIEVPVMLFLVWAAMRLAPRLFGVRALPVAGTAPA